MKRALAAGACACALGLVLAPVAAGHALVRPATAAPDTATVFTVLAPDEHATPQTGMRLTIPSGLLVSSVEDVPGYRAQIVRDQSFRAVAVSWQGGRTVTGHLAAFRFVALTPQRPGPMRFVVQQTFSDGSTTTWRPAVAVVGRGGGIGTATAIALGLAAAALAVALAALALAVKRR